MLAFVCFLYYGSNNLSNYNMLHIERIMEMSLGGNVYNNLYEIKKNIYMVWSYCKYYVFEGIMEMSLNGNVYNNLYEI